MAVCVYDFDKTLTYRDSFTQLTLSQLKKAKIALLPLYFCLKLLSRFRLISVKKEKELCLRWFFPKNIDDFNRLCVSFAPRIRLSPIRELLAEDIKRGNTVYILSASPECYIRTIFPDAEVIGMRFRTDSCGEIVAIDRHPYSAEKRRILESLGIMHIDYMYYDSKSDEVLRPISERCFQVKNGQII